MSSPSGLLKMTRFISRKNNIDDVPDELSIETEELQAEAVRFGEPEKALWCAIIDRGIRDYILYRQGKYNDLTYRLKSSRVPLVDWMSKKVATKENPIPLYVCLSMVFEEHEALYEAICEQVERLIDKACNIE